MAADEVVIRFTGEGGSLLSTTKAISGEVKTLGDLFDKLKNQSKNSYIESSKGATALASALGVSHKNAKEFAASIGLSNQAATQATQRLKELDGAGASLGVKYRTLRSELGLTRQAFESLNSTYNQNTKAQTQLAQTLGVTQANARNLANGLGLSATQANTAIERYRELSGVGATLAEKQRVLTQELGLTNEQFTQIRGTALATREGLTTLAGVAGGVSAALSAIGAKGVAVFAEFDKEIRTFAVTSKATPDQVAAITDRIEQLAQVSGKTPQELAATTTELARTGFTAEQIAASMEGLAFASIATGENLGRTGEVFASTVTQFKVASKDFDRIADILVTGANASAGGIDSIGEGLKYVGTSAKTANQSAEETVKTLAILSNVGLKGSIGGTSLDEFLRRLSLTSAQAGTDLTELRTKGGKAAVTAFKLIGASVRDARGELLPISTIIPKLRESLASLDAGDKSLVLNQIFGAQGGRAALALLDATGDVVAKVDSEFATLEGTAKRTGQALNQGPAAGMAKLRASSDTALRAIGGFVAQGFLPMIDAAGMLLSGFNNLNPQMQGFVVGIGSVAAALFGAIAAVATYNLINGKFIVQQTIAAAGTVRDTVFTAANTTAKIANNAAAAAMAIVRGVITAATVAYSIATGKATIATVLNTVAMNAGTIAAAKFGASIVALAAPLAALALVGGAAAGVAVLVTQTEKLADVNNSLAESYASTKVVQDSAVDTQFKMKAAIDRTVEANANGVAVSAEQVKQNKILIAQAGQQISILKQQLKTAEAVPQAQAGPFGLGEEEAKAQNNARSNQIESIKAQIEQIERQRSTLASSTTAEKSAADATDKGAKSKRSAADAAKTEKDALDALKASIEGVTRQRELGAISEAEAIGKLQAIESSQGANTEGRKAAADAILEIKKDQIDSEIAAIQAGQAAIEASVATGNKTEADGEKELTALKIAEIDKRIAAAELEAANATGSDRSKILSQVKSLEAEKTKVQAEGSKKAAAAAQKEQLDGLKKAQDEALDVVQQSEQERLIAIQKGVNDGVLTQQQADRLRANSTRDRLAGELEAARQNQAALEAIDTASLDKAGQETIEQSKRDARKQTTALTLQLLQQEEAAQKAARDAAIEGIQKELAARNLAFDVQLSKIADIRAKQAEGAALVEQSAQREAAAFEQAANALQRQSSLLVARGNLLQAQSSLAQTETTIAIDRVKQAASLRKELDNQNLSQVERLAITKELNALGVSTGRSSISLLQQQQKLEAALSAQKREALAAEQEGQRAALELESQRNQIAAQRSVTEARINELKAQQQVLSAQAALQEQRLNDERTIAAARSELQQAQVGGDRQQVAAAQTQVQLAQAAAARNQRAAATGVDLAQQQAELSKQSTSEAIAAQGVNSQLEAIARQTLEVQQMQASKQLEAAIAAERQAAALTLARAQAEAIGAAQGGTQIQPRFAGGPVSPGQLYTMAEKGPEMVTFSGGRSALINSPGLYTVPSAGVVHTATETRAMLARSVPSASGTIATRSAGPKADPLLDEMRKTRRAIEARKQLPPANITVNSGDDRTIDRTLRSIIRSRY
jgi:TP901 family phage tail tape measure protein